jgi:hypothetical protein
VQDDNKKAALTTKRAHQLSTTSKTDKMTGTMNSENKKTTLKIACCSLPFSGHMNPMISLVKGLASKKRDNNNNKDFNYEICVFTFGEDCHKKHRKQSTDLNVDINILHIPDIHTNEEIQIVFKDKTMFPDNWESTFRKRVR